jgi:hypothetical protein
MYDLRIIKEWMCVNKIPMILDMEKIEYCTKVNQLDQTNYFHT